MTLGKGKGNGMVGKEGENESGREVRKGRKGKGKEVSPPKTEVWLRHCIGMHQYDFVIMSSL